MKLLILLFLAFKLLVGCLGSPRSADASVIVVDTRGRRCTPVYLDSLSTGRLHVTIGEVQDSFCAPELIRLQGSGDGVHGSPCDDSPSSFSGSAARRPLLPSNFKQWAFMELYSECEHPMNVTLQVIQHPIPSFSAPTLDRLTKPQRSRKLQQSLSSGAGAESSPAGAEQVPAQQAQQQQSPTGNGNTTTGDGSSTGSVSGAGNIDSASGGSSTGGTNGAGSGGSSANNNNGGDETSSIGSGGGGNSSGVAEGFSPPLPFPGAPPPAPITDDSPVCCCWRSNRVYPIDQPPHNGCCCGTYKECCKPKFTPFAFCNNSTGCIVGLGVGLVTFAVLCTLVAIWLMWRRRRRTVNRRFSRSSDSLAVLSNLKEEELDGKTVTPPTQDQLGSSLECPVCLDTVTVTASNWIIFPCSETHGMCTGCLADMIRHNARHPRQRHVIQCPLCRKMAVGRVRGGVRAGTAATTAAADHDSSDAASLRASSEIPGNQGISAEAGGSGAVTEPRPGEPGGSGSTAVELSTLGGDRAPGSSQ